MKNTDKCHVLISGYKHEHVFAKIGTEKNMGKWGCEAFRYKY